MAQPKGSHLYVNLSASQTRRRLKGFGHGVKKIQSAGKNQAVIIHTATGRHLEELERKFTDVGCSTTGELRESVANLRNIGPRSAEWLREVGITSIADLERFGPPLAYGLVRQRHSEAGLNLLWALAAGLEDRDWRDLSEVEKEKLLSQLEE